MQTGTLGGMPGDPGVTALEHVVEEPPTLCDDVLMEGKPHLTLKKTQQLLRKENLFVVESDH